MMAREDVAVRVWSADDRALVLDTWTRSYHAHAIVYMGWIGVGTFASLYRTVLDRCIDGGRNVRVVALVSDPSVVVAWACLDARALHYVWVRDGWRREGLARMLLDDRAGSVLGYTHCTPRGRQFVAQFPRWRYQPELLRCD